MTYFFQHGGVVSDTIIQICMNWQYNGTDSEYIYIYIYIEWIESIELVEGLAVVSFAFKQTQVTHFFLFFLFYFFFSSSQAFICYLSLSLPCKHISFACPIFNDRTFTHTI